MKTITLYTGEGGHSLFKNGLSFLATEDKQYSHDYKVTAPIENVVPYSLEDELSCYDVIKMDGVTVEKDSQ